jgi:hypothetical protein
MDEIENMLMRYRPMGPGEELRRRVLGEEPAHSYRIWVVRAAVAAMLLVAVGLEWSARVTNQRTVEQIGVGRVTWDANAERAANLIGGGEHGREYIALCLLGDRRGPSPQPSPGVPGEGEGERNR